MRAIGTGFVAGLAALMTLGCGGQDEAKLERVAEEYLNSGKASGHVKDYIKGAQKAAVSHAAKLAGERPEGNLMISPFSYQECLGMVRLGALGDTNKELAKWLGTGEDSAKTASAMMANRSSLKPLVDAGIISTANGVWVSSAAQIEPGYLKQVQQSFNAEVKVSQFPQPALTEINSFVKEQTKGRIEKILEELDPYSRMVLVNAIHFKDKWHKPFKKERTKEEPFHAPDGPKQVFMMHGGEGFSGARKEGFLFVSTQFKTGLRVAFALPPSKEDPVEKCLEPLMKMVGETFSLEVSEVALPKFKSEFTWNMKPSMQAMGVSLPFDVERAQFGGMSKEPLSISQIVQKTFVQFDEEGVEAAAVTAADMAAGSAPMDEEPVRFIADRPYAYVIYDKDGMPLFLGIVRDPIKG